MYLYSRYVLFNYTFFLNVWNFFQVQEPVVVVAYPHSAQQFWADVRKEEEEMGISISDGVPLDMYTGMTLLRLFFSSINNITEGDKSQ